LPKITMLHCFFPSKLISKCCNFSMNWDTCRVKGFSASVTSYPKIELRPFLACHMSKILTATIIAQPGTVGSFHSGWGSKPYLTYQSIVPVQHVKQFTR
jgi:hypothetical protein